MRERKRVGVIGVDAGLCWVGDPCYVIGKGNSLEMEGKKIDEWGDFCGLLFSKERPAQFNYTKGRPGLGVCVSTGYGDGEYPVYAEFDDGVCVGVYVDFDPKCDESEENDD